MNDSSSTSPTSAPAGSAEGMVDNLVTQFSSALDCFRELVQNSIDAGTSRVDIWMDYEPGEGHEGTIKIHVEDFGEGMDEQIIDEQLTRLFASGKSEDLTKIGKFGIGFVSVFALQPKAVLVHTGRSGEYWEVLFHEDRSFSKTRVDNPVEGTQITIFLEDEYHRYQQLAEEIPATLKHWCSHSAVEVTFEDRFNNDDFAPPEVINEPFEVDGICHQTVEHEGTEIVIAYNERPIYGFYNRGLTLSLTDVGDDVLGRWKRRFELISFKIKSRYLEHTLARDSVIQDEQYERAMTLVEDAANGPLLDALVGELEELAAADQWSVEQYHRYGRLVKFLAQEPSEELMRHADRPILRCLNGSPMTLADAWASFREHNRLLVAAESTPLVEQLGALDVPVIAGRAPTEAVAGELRSVSRLLTHVLTHKAGRPVRGFLWRAKTAIGGMFGDSTDAELDQKIRRRLMPPQAVYFPVAVDDEVDEQLRPLIDDTRSLLNDAGVKLAELTTGVATSGDDPPFVMMADEIGPLMPRTGADATGLEDQPAVVVNRNHPQFEAIASTLEHDPAMAAYMLARAVTAAGGSRAGEEMIESALGDVRRQYS